MGVRRDDGFEELAGRARAEGVALLPRVDPGGDGVGVAALDGGRRQPGLLRLRLRGDAGRLASLPPAALRNVLAAEVSFKEFRVSFAGDPVSAMRDLAGLLAACGRRSLPVIYCSDAASPGELVSPQAYERLVQLGRGREGGLPLAVRKVFSRLDGMCVI
ncbi:MAG: hypothetical protein JRN39_03195 [Nitrososphaerota archaeon]|nr:hypothetical protein [Nitrososphaerota archaeon]